MISCGLFAETQSHLLQCPVITTKLNYFAVNSEKYDENYLWKLRTTENHHKDIQSNYSNKRRVKKPTPGNYNVIIPLLRVHCTCRLTLVQHNSIMYYTITRISGPFEILAPAGGGRKTDTHSSFLK